MRETASGSAPEILQGLDNAFPAPAGQRPMVRLSDIWKSPLHDLPVRDELIYQFLPLSSGMKLLEIGPGNGLAAFRLSRQVGHITLLDVAPGNVERLGRTLAEVPNLSFACADVSAPELPEEAGSGYDAIVGIEVFEYIPNPGRCLRNLASALKPGGNLLLQWPNYPPEKAGGVTYFRDSREIDVLMESAGFTSWALYSLRLKPWAGTIFKMLHEAPLRWYRRNRARTAIARPQTFDETWAFQSGPGLSRYRFFLHSAWALIIAMMRLGGGIFERAPLIGTGLDRNILLIARR